MTPKVAISDTGTATLGFSQDRDLQLAIDSQIQFFAEKALAEGVQKTGAESGSVIIMEPATGNVVAWADYPSFDANNFGGTDSKLFTDPVVSGLYEPGSVMKAFTISALIKSPLN